MLNEATGGNGVNYAQSSALTALLWVWIFHPQFGLLNYLLSLVNIDGAAWLASQRWAKQALIIMGLMAGL